MTTADLVWAILELNCRLPRAHVPIPASLVTDRYRRRPCGAIIGRHYLLDGLHARVVCRVIVLKDNGLSIGVKHGSRVRPLAVSDITLQGTPSVTSVRARLGTNIAIRAPSPVPVVVVIVAWYAAITSEHPALNEHDGVS